MILTKIQANELGQMMREHIACILRMNAVRLKLNWTAEFTAGQIISCCDRMAKHLDCTLDLPKNIQRELIQNPQFAPWLARLTALVGEAAANNGPEEPRSDWDNLARRLDELLKACQDGGRSITAYSENDVLFAMEQLDSASAAQLTYLESFAPMELDDGTRTQILMNLSACGTVPVALDEDQRALLKEPFVGSRYLFASADFEDIWALFQFCPTLNGIARMLHQKGINEHLTLTDYQYFAEDGAEYQRLLALVLQRLSADAAGRFLHYWRENNCALSELQRMERRTRAADVGELDTALVSYTGYVNLIYGKKFKTISLNCLTGCQETLLLYAITHEKKHFIRLIDENADKFLGLSKLSILFYAPLYRDHFNLNELTIRDLEDCGWMTQRNLPKNLLTGSRQYTFPELRLLYDAPGAYVTLYGRLHTPSLDYRIKVLRQLRKRNALDEISGEMDLAALAGWLDQKPLADWQREEFAHIKDIRAEDAAQILVHLDKLRPVLPSIRCRADVMLVLRSLDYLDRFDSLEALKASLLEIDLEWKGLADVMKLSPEFKERHQEGIIKFLCQDGAGVAGTYLDSLSEKLHPAFCRVVKAELMGQFKDLKYHTGDLERELDYPLDAQAKAAWTHNISLTQGRTEIREKDDFFSTMLLGTQPYATCLSYHGGAYCDCLLACFDSNKKVLYAERDGRVVARACVRLTKCCMNGTPKGREDSAGKFSFADIEAENGPPEEQHQGERLALFLEHLYSSGLSPEEQLQIKALFVQLVQQKAGMLDALLVLSLDYREAVGEGFARTSLYLYISASKAGGQYLDSLGGQAEVSSEGSYKKNTFLVEQAKGHPGGIDEMTRA